MCNKHYHLSSFDYKTDQLKFLIKSHHYHKSIVNKNHYLKYIQILIYADIIKSKILNLIYESKPYQYQLPLNIFIIKNLHLSIRRIFFFFLFIFF